MASSTTALFINIAHRERLWENFLAASLHFCTWKVSCQLLPVIPLLLLVPDFGWCTFQDVFIYLFIYEQLCNRNLPKTGETLLHAPTAGCTYEQGHQ